MCYEWVSQNKGWWMFGAAALSLPFMADFFTLASVPKVTQAFPVAVFFPEQEVWMRVSTGSCICMCNHEMTGWYTLFKLSPGTAGVAHTRFCVVLLPCYSFLSLASLTLSISLTVFHHSWPYSGRWGASSIKSHQVNHGCNLLKYDSD